MGCRTHDVRAAFGYNARGELKKVIWIDEIFGMTERLARNECGLELAPKADSARRAPHCFQRRRAFADLEQFHALETVAHIEAGIGGI
jgi:hypothetical protein